MTPAATSRSQTCWAAPAGVAITPIDTPLSATIASSSSMCCTGSPGDRPPGQRRVGVDQRGDPEPREANPP